MCARHGERVLETTHNPISMGKPNNGPPLEETLQLELPFPHFPGVTLSSSECLSKTDWTEFGSMLFLKSVSGTRCVIIITVALRKDCYI